MTRSHAQNELKQLELCQNHGEGAPAFLRRKLSCWAPSPPPEQYLQTHILGPCLGVHIKGDRDIDVDIDIDS